MRELFIAEPRVEWASSVGAGMSLEISALVDNRLHLLVTLLARDDDESLWVQVQAGDALVAVPLPLMQKLLNEAVGQVHSEAWYDRRFAAQEGSEAGTE